MRHIFIINPHAGKKDQTGRIYEMADLLRAQHGLECQCLLTQRPGGAEEMARRLAESGEALRLYACGGDGTVSEVANGIAGFPNAAMTCIPTGTGNDFLKNFGPDAARFADVENLWNGEERQLDLIDCNGRFCSNICSVGIDARIGTSVHNYSKIPVIGGATGYVVSLIVNVFKGINRHMRVRIKDFYVDEELALVCVCNGRYYGGGFNPSLTARPDDGVLDVFVVKKVGLITLARMLGKYASGRADECPQYITRIQTDEVSISFDEDNVINIDGEAVFSKDVNIHVIHNAVKLIVPAGMKFFEQSAAAAAAV